MQRWLAIAPLVVVLAACGGAPSDVAVQGAAAKVAAAPVPEGSSERFAPDDELLAVRIGSTNIFRAEMCSDGSCPFVLRGFESVDYPSLGDACAAVDRYIEAVGGTQRLPSCPPPEVAGTIGLSGDRGQYSDIGVVVVPDGEFGNTVVFTLSYTADRTGVWIPGTAASVRLGIGQQFCSDSAIAQACVSD